MKGYMGYERGDKIFLKAPTGSKSHYNHRHQRVALRITAGKVYKGVVEEQEAFNLGIKIVDDSGKPFYTSLKSPAVLGNTVDWIIWDPFLENLQNILSE